MKTISGKVIDTTTGEGIPSATVSLVDNFGYEIPIGQTNNNGEFSETITPAELEYTDMISFTSVSHKGVAVPIEKMLPGVKVYMQRNVKELPPVVVTTTKKSFPWLLLLVLLLIPNKKK